MNSQKQLILNMLTDKEFVCVTEMMQAYIPDYRRRLVDLKHDGYILSGRPCQQHEHKSKILKEWHLISAPRVEPPLMQDLPPVSDLHPLFDEILTQPQQVPLL